MIGGAGLAPAISESERRWSDWRGGRAIALPDGQTWHFYMPRPIVRPVPDDAGVVVGVPSWTFDAGDPDVDLALAGIFAAILLKRNLAMNDADRAGGTLEAAWFLLARNYNVTMSEFESILAGAAACPGARQASLGRQLHAIVKDALDRSLSLAEAG